MKVWITRADAVTLSVKEEAGLTMWFDKPTFDATPRGAKDGQFACQPIGWAPGANCRSPLGAASLSCQGLSKEPAALQPVWRGAYAQARSALPPGVVSPEDGFYEIDAMFALPTGEEASFCIEVDLDAAAAMAARKRLQQQQEQHRQALIASRTGRDGSKAVPF